MVSKKMINKVPLPEKEFMPCTMEREIAKDIVFRPLREERDTLKLAVTHRIYWHRKNPEVTVSAVLFYPGLAVKEYYWETLGTRKDEEIERFFGRDAERKMERKIIRVLEEEYKKRSEGDEK